MQVLVGGGERGVDPYPVKQGALYWGMQFGPGCFLSSNTLKELINRSADDAGVSFSLSSSSSSLRPTTTHPSFPRAGAVTTTRR